MKYFPKIRQIKAFFKFPSAIFIGMQSLTTLILILFSLKLIAQVPTTPPMNPNQVAIIKADSLVGINQGFLQQRKLIEDLVEADGPDGIGPLGEGAVKR